MPAVRPHRLLLGALVGALVACGGGGDGSRAGTPALLSVNHLLDPGPGGPFVVSGTDLPGAAGADVTIHLRASDGLALAECGDDVVTFPGTLLSSSSVSANLPTFSLTRGVLAYVTIDLPDGSTVASASPIASLVGTLDDAFDHDLDGVLDVCDPDTYTFDEDDLGARPADVSFLDAPGGSELVVVPDGVGRAAAFAGPATTAAERFDRLAADAAQDDVIAYADVDASVAGSFALELWSDGTFARASGAALVVQVAADGAMSVAERVADALVLVRAAPALPASGRFRVRVHGLPGGGCALHLDLREDGRWANDRFVHVVADARAYVGTDTVVASYDGGARPLRRLTVGHETP